MMTYGFKGKDIFYRKTRYWIRRVICCEELVERGLVLWAYQDKAENPVSWEGLFVTEPFAYVDGNVYTTMGGVTLLKEATPCQYF